MCQGELWLDACSQPFALNVRDSKSHRRCFAIKKLLPGFEPGSLDSKSRVLTITPQERLIRLCNTKVVPMGIEPMTLGLLDQCSTI